MKLQYVEIESFLGIQSARFNCDDVTLFVGKSRSGKTSAINAIYAALKSKGFGPECICDDADRWRVMLKFDKATVETIVRRSGNKSVKVDGLGLGSPQAKLDAVFPDLIDPWRLANDEPSERRRKVLAAMPATVLAEDAKRWTGEDWTPEEGKHGMDVVADLHAHYYAKRTAANAAVTAAKSALQAAQDEADRLAIPAGSDIVTIPKVGEEDAPVVAAQKSIQDLEQRRQQAEAMAIRTAGTREKIAKLRAEQAEIEAGMGEPPAVAEKEEIEADVAAKLGVVEDLKRQLLAAEQSLMVAQAKGAAWSKRMNAYNKAEELAGAKQAAAEQLEATLAEATIEPPTADELAAAEAALAAAKTHADLVRASRKALNASLRVSAMSGELEAAKAEAKRLDDIVKRLDNEAPAELAARANMPAGLSFVDGDIALDGHQFKLLSESEKAELCVEAVKRIAPDAGFLRIDKLEGMDPDLREDFIRKAKSGGWQIIGTVVERGEVRIVTVDADDEEEVVHAEPREPTTNGKPSRLKILMPEDVPAK